MLDSGQTIAFSRSGPLITSDDPALKPKLLSARDGLFDSELYHQLCIEGRDLISRGVKCTDKDISIPLGGDKSLELALVDADDTEMDLHPENEHRAYDKLPQVVVIAMRILLCYAFRQRYNDRTKAPLPLTERRQQPFSSPVLHPIVSWLEHRSVAGEVRNFLTNLQSLLVAASLKLEIKPSDDSFGVTKARPGSEQSGISEVESLVKRLNDAVESQFEITSHSMAIKIILFVRTHTTGTEFKVKLDPKDSRAELREHNEEATFSAFEEAKDYICHFLSVDLLLDIERQSDGRWFPQSLHSEELTTEEDLKGRFQSLALRLSEDSMALKWSATTDDEPREESEFWYQGDSQQESFQDVVAKYTTKEST